MWARLWNKLRFGRRDVTFDRDLNEELDFHRAMLEHDRGRADDGDATTGAEARRVMGNVHLAREDARREWGFPWIEAARRDVYQAVRAYRHAPGFAATAVLVLALGLGANMAVFRFVDAVLFETLPVPRPQELVLVGPRVFSYPAFRELSAGTRDVLTHTAARHEERLYLTKDGQAEYLAAETVSGAYFDTLGTKPAVGRLLTIEDDGAEGASRVAVISYRLWQRLFAGHPGVVGAIVRLNNEPFEIVGVTERGFDGGALHARADVQVPLSMVAALGRDSRDSRGVRWLRVIGRLAPGVSREQADGVVRGRFNALEQPGASASQLTVTDGRQGFGTARYTLLDAVLVAQLLSAGILIISMSCLTGLLLARVAARRPELAMREALGASRRRLVVQLMVEVGGLVLIGAVGAACFGVVLDRQLLGMLGGPDQDLHIRAVPSALGVAGSVGLSMLVAIGVGLLSALSATRRLPIHNLREAGRASTGRHWLAGPLIVAQTAVCLVLVFGAGLLGRTLFNLRTVDLGLDPARVAVVTASPREAGLSREREAEYFAEWLSRAKHTPGVESASLAAITALSQAMFAYVVEVPGAEPRTGPAPNNNVNVVTGDYFETVGLPILEGRPFTDTDTSTAPRVAIVNERFVEYYWPGQSPIGRTIELPRGQMTIVGLVPTAKYQSVREDPQITIYLPYAQQAWSQMTLHARVAGSMGEVGAALVTAGRAVDPTVPVHGVATMNDHVNARLANERVLNVLGLTSGGLALLVAAVGLYGTVSYAVARRTREIGIRTAIGARRHQIIRLFAGRTMGLVAAGLVVGTPVALLAGRSLGTVLFGIDGGDAGTFIGTAAGLVAVALAATLVPAVRGSRLDPTTALREP